jgi:hypothetical protein
MRISRKTILSTLAAAQCWVAAVAAIPARAAEIPDYFFTRGSVSKNCAEQHAGLAARVSTGLQFEISRDSQTSDGSYVFHAVDGAQQRWAANWNGLKLVYRPGTEMTTLPADFECIPGQEASSPFLAMSDYAQATEPYYEHAHWYGLAKIHGQLEHILIFPRRSGTGPSAVIVMQSVVSPTSVQLDDNGVIFIQK